MAYSLRADGLTDLHMPDGTVMPMALSPEQLQQMGHQEIPASAPARGPDLRVAGPGGGDPRDMSGGAGVFGQAPAAAGGDERLALQAQPFRDAYARATAPSSHASGPAPSGLPAKFDTPLPPGTGLQRPDLADPTVSRGTAAAGKPGFASDQPLDPEQELIFKEALRRGGGGGGKPGLGVTKRTEKYTTYGAVPKELSEDIAKRGSDLEAQQAADLELHHDATSRFLEERDARQWAQLADIEDQRAQREQVNARLQQLQQTRDQREQEVQTMPPADLHRYWGERGIASQVMTGLSIALGGYVQGLRGGENPGLQMANRSIDTWLQTERDKYDRAKDSAARADSQFGKALALYGTPEMAENDMRARAYAVRDSMLANQLDQIGNADAYAKGQEALQAGALQRQQLKAQAIQMAGEKAVEDTLSQRATGGMSAADVYLNALRKTAEGTKLRREINGGGDPEQVRKDAADARERQVRMPDGSVKYVPAASARKDVQTAIDGRTDIIAKIEQLRTMQQNSNLVTDMKARAEYDSLAAAVKAQATVLAGQGAMSEGDRANIENGIPTSGVHLKDAAAALATTAAGQRAALNSVIRGSVYNDPQAKTPYAESTTAPSSARDVE